MNYYELELQRTMTPEQRLAFQSEYNSRRKDTTVGVLLALFLGGFGAHHFYLKRIGLGVVYLLFCWTLIPGIIALVECFFMSRRVEQYNNTLAAGVAARVRMLYANAPASLPLTVYCSKCGQQMPADARFCAGCGSEVAALAVR